MTYEADANLTPDKVFILKSEEIANYGVAKQEQLLDLMAEASELYPDASATQVIEFAKQRLLTRNVLSSYQEITAPPLPSLLELTSGPATEEPTVEETVEEVPLEEAVEEIPVDEAVEEETPSADVTEVWYAPEDLNTDAEEPSEQGLEADAEPEVETGLEAEAEEAEGTPEEPADELEVAEEPLTDENEELPSEEPAQEAEYTLEEEVEDYVGEEQPGDSPGDTSYGADAAPAYTATEEGSSEEVPSVEQNESPLVTSYQEAPTILKKDRRWVGLLEAAGRLDAKGD